MLLINIIGDILALLDVVEKFLLAVTLMLAIDILNFLFHCIDLRFYFVLESSYWSHLFSVVDVSNAVIAIAEACVDLQYYRIIKRPSIEDRIAAVLFIAIGVSLRVKQVVLVLFR